MLAEADAQQAFVDILAEDVIKPLQTLKVSREDHFARDFCSNSRVVWKKLSDDTKHWNENNLQLSASRYADHAEKRVVKLQKAYSKRYQRQKYHDADSANVSQRPQNVPNKKLASVTDDECREAVADLNRLRRARAEDLEAGYDVGDILCYNT